jgi:hypothetical protein
MSSLWPWEKSHWPRFSLSLFLKNFLSSPNKEKTEHQSESNPATNPGTLANGKLPHTMLQRKQQCHFSPPAGYKAASVKPQKKQVNIMHHA